MYSTSKGSKRHSDNVRDITPKDNLGEELTHALQRSIEQQIAQDPTLTPHSTVHFTVQSSAFTHAFPIHHFHCARIRRRKRKTRHLSSSFSQPNSTPTKNLPPTTPLPWKPPSYAHQVQVAETENNTDLAKPPSVQSSNSHA